jgi:hypothetical protein
MAKVTVRVAVAVDHRGVWNAAGWNDSGEVDGPVEVDDEEFFRTVLDFIEPGERRYVLTAELDVPDGPEAVEVPASVSSSSSEAGDAGSLTSAVRQSSPASDGRSGAEQETDA